MYSFSDELLCTCWLRVARDGYPYRAIDFVEHYGWEAGRVEWNDAPLSQTVNGLRPLPDHTLVSESWNFEWPYCYFDGFVEHCRNSGCYYPVHAALQSWQQQRRWKAMALQRWQESLLEENDVPTEPHANHTEPPWKLPRLLEENHEPTEPDADLSSDSTEEHSSAASWPTSSMNDNMTLISMTTPSWLSSPRSSPSDLGDAAQHVEQQSSEGQAILEFSSPRSSDVGNAAQHVEQQSSEGQAIVAQVFEIYWASISRSCYVGWNRGTYVEAPLAFKIGWMKCSNGTPVPMYTTHRRRLAMVMPSVAALQKQFHMQAVVEDPQWGLECSKNAAKPSNIMAEWDWYWY